MRVAGVAERRRVLAERHAEVERRLAGHAEERASAAARRERLEAEGTALRRLEALVEAEHAPARRRVRRAAPRLPGPGRRGAGGRREARATPTGPPHHRAASRCGAQPHPRPRPRGQRGRSAHRVVARAHRPRPRTPAPRSSIGLPQPEAPADTTLPQHADELERKLTALGPGQPARARGALPARGAPQGARGTGRRRARRAPRAARGRAHARPRDHDVVRRRGRRRERALLHADRDAVPRRHGPPHAGRPRRPVEHGRRDRGAPCGPQRAPRLAAVGRRALDGGAGVPLRRLPQPPLALLHDGRGRGRAR